MTLRQAVTRRVDLIANLTDAAAFIEGLVERGGIISINIETQLTFQVRSKAEADKVIDEYAPAARPLWRNGVYMAELDTAKLPVPRDPQRGEPNRRGVIVEMHFVPPILEQAA